MQHTEPTMTLRIRGNGTQPVTSGNSRRVMTTSQYMKNKKRYKEKKIKTNEEAHNCRVSIPFNVTKQVRIYGRISSKHNIHGTEKDYSRTKRSLWGQYSDVKNRKTSNCNQERNNANRIKNPLKQHIEYRFLKTDRKSAPSLNSATCTPRRLYSDVWNANFSQEVRNHHHQLNHILQMKPQEKLALTASSAQHPVRQWSVEAVTPASHNHLQDCCETNEDIAPDSATKELEEIMAQSSNSETSARSNYFSCNRILMAVANTMVVFLLGALQPICSEVNAQLAKIERNQRIKHCSSILMAAANAMVVFVLGSVKLVCSHLKSQFSSIEINQRMNHCSCILTAVANAMMGVVLCVMQSLRDLRENRKVIKDVIFRILWRAIHVLYDLMTNAVIALKSIAGFIFRNHAAVSQLRASKSSEQENTSHEITRASPSNIRKDLKRNKAAGVQDRYQLVSSTEMVADQTYITNHSPVKTRNFYHITARWLFSVQRCVAESKKFQRGNTGQQKWQRRTYSSMPH